MVFNGEVYNHAEIRTELEVQGVYCRSRCDTEVVLKAYLHWGRKSFEKLRGMFAFAIWQDSERKLMLVRDRMGIAALSSPPWTGPVFRLRIKNTFRASRDRPQLRCDRA
ncbi:MAG: hypothetical protein WKF37_00370 [Bryobacteraceae bacterium]